MCEQFVRCNSEQTQLTEKILYLAIEKTVVTHCHDACAGIVGYEISYAALVEYHSLVTQMLVAAHHRVGIDLKCGSILAHRRYALTLLKCSCHHTVAYSIGNLQIYGFAVFLEYHDYFLLYHLCTISASLRRITVSV